MTGARSAGAHADRPAAQRTRTAWWKRLALLLGTTLLWLGVAEWAVRRDLSGDAPGLVQEMLASRQGIDLDAEHRMLCVGDSYTFGLYYRLEDSFPGRLERLLNHGLAEGERKRWVVINGGIPAQNTAQIVAALPAQLERFRPEVVVVLGGHNNRWNLADPEREGALGAWFHDLALVKLVRILAHPKVEAADPDERITSWSEEEVGVRVAGSDTRVEVDKTADRLADDAVVDSCLRDWRLLQERCREAGARVLFTCYPSPEPAYAAPQEAARRAAEEGGAEFVDARALFAELLATRPYHELLIPGDRHPTDRGYFHLAVALARRMAERGWVDWDGGGGGPERLHPTRLRQEAGRLILEGLPRGRFRVVLAGRAAPVQHFGDRVVPVAADEVFAEALDREALRGRFDDAGEATVEIPADLRARARVAAVVVLFDHVKGIDRTWTGEVWNLKLRDVSGPLMLSDPGGP